MRTTIVGIISILTAYKLSKLLMILFKGIADFLQSSEDKLDRFSGSVIDGVFFSFPSVSVLILTLSSFIFIFFLIDQLIDYFFE
jgi:hypothetical protein